MVNTMMGDMLDHSWRICAQDGVLVELGKADIRSRGYLSLEPFDRGCSFRALDLTLVLAQPERISGYDASLRPLPRTVPFILTGQL